MKLLQAVAISSLVYLAVGTAIPVLEGPKLGKRSVTFERVAAGWRERDVLHSKVLAMQKFGIPMSVKLRTAHAENRVKAKLRIKHHKSNDDESGIAGNGIVAGPQTVTVTVTAAPTTNTGGPVGIAASDRNSTDHSTGNGGSSNTMINSSTTGSAVSAALPTSSQLSTSGSMAANRTKPAGQTGVAANMPASGDVEFLTEISIGGQKIVMNFDTGSSDLYVSSIHILSTRLT